MEMFVEFKHGNSCDPFNTKKGTFPKSGKNHSSTRGQLALYATRQQAYQFRTWTISVGIFGPVARLFRWDRTGCQVTDPIKYTSSKGNEKLTEFFLRLDRMAGDPEARGWDPTVVDPAVEEIRDFDAALKVAFERPLQPQPTVGAMTRSRKRAAAIEQKVLDPMFYKLAESVGDHEKYPRRKVSVYDGDIEKAYIVGRPTSMPKSPIGRATRGFVAMSVETRKVVFLKDSWRPDLESIKAEDEWFKQLKKKKGFNKACIGAYLHGSDVYATRQLVKHRGKRQRTITHHADGFKDLGRMLGYIHYRVIQTELYLPLETFEGSKHLVDVMDDIGEGRFL
jgi:hypothetical protein